MVNLLWVVRAVADRFEQALEAFDMTGAGQGADVAVELHRDDVGVFFSEDKKRHVPVVIIDNLDLNDVGNRGVGEGLDCSLRHKGCLAGRG